MDYELRESVPTPESFVALREAAEMGTRSVEAATQALPNTLYGVSLLEKKSGETVGMARVVGDRGCYFQICDVVVDPAHQGGGLGSWMMDAVMEFLTENAPETAYVNLIADVDGFYEQWGFKPTAPESQAMYLLM